MSKNGFFHERPDDYDIYVNDSMKEEVGADSVNWHVSNVRNGVHNLVGKVFLPDGRIFTAISLNRGDDQYWEIVKQDDPRTEIWQWK